MESVNEERHREGSGNTRIGLFITKDIISSLATVVSIITVNTFRIVTGAVKDWGQSFINLKNFSIHYLSNLHDNFRGTNFTKLVAFIKLYITIRTIEIVKF